ncbi:MAG: type II secretion system protein GspN [Deltaproteobacteria bacterium]|nr:MAG: type II secretion system protein GspN [Deltaproteobacteria bacterium]
MNRKLALQVSAYALYALVLAGILLVWKFPYQSLQKRLQSVASDRLGLRLEMAVLSPTFPPGVNFRRFSVRPLQSDSPSLFEAGEGQVRIKILQLLRRRLDLTIRTFAYGGSVDGKVLLEPYHNEPSFQLSMSWDAVRLHEHPAIANLAGRELSGKISGELQLEGFLNKVRESTGKGNLLLEEGIFPVNSAYLKTDTLDEVQVVAETEFANGKLEIRHCQFEARGFQGDLSGVVTLHPNLSESTLNLAGKGKMESGLLNLSTNNSRVAVTFLKQDKPLPFHLRGTLTSPRFSLF